MCGIVGYVGREAATPILLAGLSKLEYRGYDSAGVALFNPSAQPPIQIYKAKGRLEVLRELIKQCDPADPHLAATIGLGHTRWATHGKPSDINAHPHLSGSGRFAVIHNGIIENYARIKADLIAAGSVFQSETDTEVIAELLDQVYDGDFLKTVARVAARLEGSYALGILCADYPGTLIGIRQSSPLIVGLGEGFHMLASDIPAVIAHTRRIYHLAEGEMVVLTKDAATVYDLHLSPVEKPVETVTWDVSSAEKDGYPHFMLKEIYEQPRALHDTLSPRVDDNGEIILDGVHLTETELQKIAQIRIVACGSAYHAGVAGKIVIEKLCRIPVEVDLASEFRYRDPLVDERTLCIIISQSGETADTLAALREAKRRGARILSIVNVVGSSIANESDDVLYTWAGPEIAVATTKAYSTQLVMLDLVALYIAEKLGKIDRETARSLTASLLKLPESVEKILKENDGVLQVLAKRFLTLEHAYFIGRNIDYAVALEASLKLKEISYIHSEAYAAGELKHGTISLIEEGVVVVALAGCHRLFDKTMSGVKEVKARDAYVLAVTTEDNTEMAGEADDIIYIPETKELFIPSLEVVPMQLLAYYIAKERGCDIDKPRNLAKSVTVE